MAQGGIRMESKNFEKISLSSLDFRTTVIKVSSVKSKILFWWDTLHHIPLDKPSIPKTAFNSPFGKFEYVKVPFRLAQAPAYFQELMAGILKEFPFAIAYLDDIIIFSKMPQEHLFHICMVFEKLKSANLSMKKSKCSFFSKEILYLGHILSATGIQPLPSKTHAIKNMKPPVTPKHGQSFPSISWILQEIHKGICQNSKTTHSAYQTANKI